MHTSISFLARVYAVLFVAMSSEVPIFVSALGSHWSVYTLLR